ncbi:hypothetical protein A244_32269 [Pseudomonas syringae pv. actinidiae ICMP 18807]|uniref:Transposase n=4 Tax=Pseudomonas syringae TaxID=317 RepID=S6UID3_PSESF|nr:transposase [Pseudomonas syringae]EPN38177.1 hypothetical protein A244_32269 [Pseudomonas syringae pv. actinidiae ICMP 18807]
MQPTRRSYSKSFKIQVIQECAQPGASIASIALHHNLNANLVHKWIRLQAPKSTALQPAFIPLPLPTNAVNQHAASPSICVEIEIMGLPNEFAQAKPLEAVTVGWHMTILSPQHLSSETISRT